MSFISGATRRTSRPVFSCLRVATTGSASPCITSSPAAGSLRQYSFNTAPIQSRIHVSTHTASRLRSPALQSWRPFSVSTKLSHGHLDPPKPGEERHVTFIEKDNTSTTFAVADGDNLLDIAQANDIEMEGACGGSCACSTCHIIVTEPDMYDKMPEPDDDENDMLDLAFGLTETSRLGCQVKMAKDLDGLVVKLPSMTRNMQASDFGKN